MRKTAMIMFIFTILIVGCKKNNTVEESVAQSSGSPTPYVSAPTADVVIPTPSPTPIPSPMPTATATPSPTPTATQTATATLTPTEALPPTPTGKLGSWIGEYKYSEFLPPNINRFYSVSVVKENDAYFADITLDGFQTMERLRAKVTGDEKVVDFIFEKYLPQNVSEPYKVGDTLLRFEKKESSMITYWGAISPFDKSSKSGNVYFENSKVSDALEAYKAVLQNKVKFFSTEEKNNVFLNDFLTNEQVYVTTFHIMHFTVLDLDGDVVPEVVLEIAPGENPNPEFSEVLHYMDGLVYGYIQVYRGFNQLKTDGTFGFAGSAFNDGVGKLRFNTDADGRVELGYRDTRDVDNQIFIVNNEPVTAEAYKSFRNEEDGKPDVTWHEFSPKNIETTLSSTQNH